MTLPKLNLQNPPKTREYMECWVARPGHKLLDIDWDALEPKVLTYFSRCPNLLKLYGPGAKKQDIYLFNGALIPGALGEQVRKYYDPDNPTPEGIATAKKKLKKLRDALKIVVLSYNYGAGVAKLHSELQMAGFDYTMAEVAAIKAGLDEAWRIQKRFTAGLEQEWLKNGGWILNGRGRPLAVHHSKKKDLLNRFIQSTGHDITQCLIYHVDRLRREQDVEMYPWFVDFHDETIWECRDELVETATGILCQARDAVNAELQWDVPMTGTPEVGLTLADLKCED